MHPDWLKELKAEFEKPYMENLSQFIRNERQSGKSIYPEPKNVFKTLIPIAPKDIKIVIVGQDPYHNPGQAHGLSFSVPEGVKAPPSLQNIFKELKSDLGIDVNRTDLTPWVNQGVLLLNSMLTVERNKPGSHQKKAGKSLLTKFCRLWIRKASTLHLFYGVVMHKKKDALLIPANTWF